MLYRQACVQPRPLAVNTALPAFAAERRAAAPCYLIPVAGDRAVSKLLIRCCRGTDGRTDARQLHRPCSAYYVGSVNKGRQSNLVGWLE